MKKNIMELKELGLSEKAIEVLKYNGVTTIEELENTTEDDVIYNFKRLGRKTLEEILTKMEEHGIRFKE